MIGTAVNKNLSPRLLFARLLPSLLMLTGTAVLLGACGYRPLSPYNTQQDLPEAVRVPVGYQAVLEARANGNLVYECQAIKRSPFEYAWLLKSPGVELTDTYGNRIMYSPGPRASWVHRDGSRTSTREFVDLPHGSFNLPLQRTKAEPSPVPGALQNISYVQRLRTVGGMVAIRPCSGAQLGMRVSVPYEADYIFWRAAA